MRFLLRLLAAVAVCLLLLAPAYGQVNLAPKRPNSPNLEPNRRADQLVPTVSYELVLAGEKVPSYVISVDSSGNAAYRARELAPTPQRGSSNSSPDFLKFTVAQPTCVQIFQLAQQAGYFEHGSAPAMAALDPTYSRANTVYRTLSYSYGPLYSPNSGTRSVRSSISFSDANDSSLQQLTGIFDGIYRVLQQGRPTQPVNVVP